MLERVWSKGDPPTLLIGVWKSHGQRSLGATVRGIEKELDLTQWLNHSHYGEEFGSSLKKLKIELPGDPTPIPGLLNNSKTEELKESQPHTPYSTAFLLLGPHSIYIPRSGSPTLFPFMDFPSMQPFSPHIWHRFFLALPQPQFGFFFFFLQTLLICFTWSTRLASGSLPCTPNPVLLSHPYLPPSIKPAPAQPHRPFKKDLGNWTELYFREINLTTMCRAGWRQQASWEPSTECENLNREWKVNENEMKDTGPCICIGLSGEPFDITEVLIWGCK